MSHYMLQAQTAEAPAIWFVCLLGISVVFLGLIALIAIVALANAATSKAGNAVSQKKEETKASEPTPPVAVNTAPIANTTIENKQEIIAAVCAAVAEENGTDISAIRVISFKKL